MSAYSSTPDSTATIAYAVVPNDGLDLTVTAKALYVGGAGNLSIIAEGSSTSVILSNVQGGSIIPVRVKRVLATGTTATDIVGLV